jgi:NADPH-dependent glutamate synthase beta subunit-like oxidoreductase/NAD(P)H-flavin reductase
MNENILNPKFGYTFADLFVSEKLKNLSEDFYKYFEQSDSEKFAAFKKYRDSLGEGYTYIQASEVIMNSSVYLSDFLGELFLVQNHLSKYVEEAKYDADIFLFKKEFVQRKVFRRFKPDDLSKINWVELDAFIGKIKLCFAGKLDYNTDEEKYTARFVNELAELEKNYRWFYEGDKFAPENFQIPESSKTLAAKLIAEIENKTEDEYANVKLLMEKVMEWVFAKRHYDSKAAKWVSYFEPEKLDFDHLVHVEIPDANFPEKFEGDEKHFIERNGFELHDHRMNEREIMNQVDYCMYCHDREKDSCSKGLTDRFGVLKSNPLGIELTGCPLNEKISEAHLLRKSGMPLAALAIVAIDNPMCPGTGHRICNDCMKGCIYQKQEPVNIPQVETNTLRDVVNLPYGFEIYTLLTRWNPINIKRPYAEEYNGKNVLVVGMGPAGYTLAHHLLNAGFGVTGIDGLKIEPLFGEYTGINPLTNERTEPKAVKDFSKEIEQELDKRILQGFGGVTEYGITVRWDKNFLSMIYVNLARRNNFRMYDGVRFGSSIKIEDAWEMGFDHIAIAAGAGMPTIVDMKNNLAKGVRKSTDYLMSLQLTGASKNDNLTSTMIQLPAVIIGGGLTAIDTTTETAAYYPVQVKRVLERYEKIAAEKGEDYFWKEFNEEDKDIVKTFIEHGREVRAEEELAKLENRKTDYINLIRKFGGVSLVYRKRMQDSPAYRLNHEEIVEALEQGVYFVENLSPAEIIKDKYGRAEKVIFEKQLVEKTEDGKVKYRSSGEFIEMPAKTVQVAAGTSPNSMYEFENPETFQMDAKWQYFKTFRPVKGEDGQFSLEEVSTKEDGFFTSYNKDGKYISFYGDNHPKYVGSVVKAMASSKKGAVDVTEVLKNREGKFKSAKDFFDITDEKFIARVHSINRLNERTVELVVKNKSGAEKFKAGQFFKLQNYETLSEKKNGITIAFEGVALAAVRTDKESGLINFVVVEEGVSTSMIQNLKEGEKVFLMGPTGNPSNIPENQNVLIAGGGSGNAVLLSIAKALKEQNNNVLYFAGYRKNEDVFDRDIIESSSDKVIWCSEEGEINTSREQDIFFSGNIIEGIKNYVGTNTDLRKINKIITAGSPGMMEAIRDARKTFLKDYLSGHEAVANVNSPMQCMMKAVCAQCLQRNIDPETGKEKYVYSCECQEQKLDEVDFSNLDERLSMNSPIEKLNRIYYECFVK